MYAESLVSAGDFHHSEKLGWDRGGDLACSQLLRGLFGCGWTWVRGSAGTCRPHAAATSRLPRAGEGATRRPSPGAVRLPLAVAGGSLPKPRARLRDDGSPGPERTRQHGGLWAGSRLQACAVITAGEAGLGTGVWTTPNRAVPERPGVYHEPGPTRSAAARAPGLSGCAGRGGGAAPEDSRALGGAPAQANQGRPAEGCASAEQ